MANTRFLLSLVGWSLVSTIADQSFVFCPFFGSGVIISGSSEGSMSVSGSWADGSGSRSPCSSVNILSLVRIGVSSSESETA